MNVRRKGQRTELECVKELEEKGYIVYRVKGSTRFNKNVDIFDLRFGLKKTEKNL